jgi:hypothetical protein
MECTAIASPAAAPATITFPVMPSASRSNHVVADKANIERAAHFFKLQCRRDFVRGPESGPFRFPSSRDETIFVSSANWKLLCRLNSAQRAGTRFEPHDNVLS